MQSHEFMDMAYRPARLLSRAALVAALIAIFTTTFFNGALPSLAPGGAEFSSTAKQVSVASHYRAKTDGYRASAANRTRQVFR